MNFPTAYKRNRLRSHDMCSLLWFSSICCLIVKMYEIIVIMFLGGFFVGKRL